MEAKYLKINPADNVAVAITALPAGEKLTVDGKEITLNEDVPAGHKFALKDFAEGENVIKYGYPIGHARKAQKQGDWLMIPFTQPTVGIIQISFLTPTRPSSRRYPIKCA